MSQREADLLAALRLIYPYVKDVWEAETSPPLKAIVEKDILAIVAVMNGERFVHPVEEARG